jgi:hypothetical protein
MYARRYYSVYSVVNTYSETYVVCSLELETSRNRVIVPALLDPQISAPSTYPADFAELVLGLLGRDAVHDEASLHVVDDAEVLARLLNLDNVHEAGGEASVRPHMAVNLHQALLHNRLHLLHGQGVLQPIPEGKS